MKTDYETIAFMFVKAAEALFMMAAKEQASIKTPTVKKQKTITRPALEKLSAPYPSPTRKGRGRPAGAKNWQRLDTEKLVSLWKKGYLAHEIAEQIGREEHAVAVKLYKLAKEKAI